MHIQPAGGHHFDVSLFFQVRRSPLINRSIYESYNTCVCISCVRIYCLLHLMMRDLSLMLPLNLKSF